MSTGSPAPAAAPPAGAPAQGNPLLGILQAAFKNNAADIHLKAHLPPKAVIDGKVIPVPGYEKVILDPNLLPRMIFAMLPPSDFEKFKTDKEVDTAFDVPGLARFRANVFMNLGTCSAVLRIIQNDIRGVDELGIPPVLKKIALEKQGLVLVTGPTGSGKSTTLGSVINFINETIAGHLVSIEDPIELVHPHKKCIISQREVGKDTNNFGRALKSALRQAPNVILIGELRDRETIELALKGAETGHLVLSTLHTNDSVQTINRILNSFPPHEREALRHELAVLLKGCVAQRLIQRSDGPGRVAVHEILVGTPTISDLIMKNEIDQCYDIIAQGAMDGMQTMNAAIFSLYQDEIISLDDALSYSDNPNELQRMMRGAFHGSGLGQK